jgi:hypothetical protein
MTIDHPGTDALIGESLIYEHVGGVVYARFRDEPKKTLYPGRWIVGGNADAIARAQGYLGYDQWKELFSLAENNSTLKKQLDKTLDIYYLIKDEK